MPSLRATGGITYERFILNTRPSAEPARSEAYSDAQRNALQETIVIIPTLNEEASLPLVLKALPPVKEVVVVDNGSTDQSADRALQMGATVVTENRKGYGSACLAGLHYIGSKPPSEHPSFVGFLDADFSDHPEELVDLLDPIIQQRADLVIGSRSLGLRDPGAMPPQARWGNRLACFLMWLFFGARHTDLGPFRVIRWDKLQALSMQDRNFGWTIEMQIKAKKLGLAVCEVPVRYRKRIGNSKISGTVGGTLRAGYKILYTIFKFAWSTRRLGQRPNSEGHRTP